MRILIDHLSVENVPGRVGVEIHAQSVDGNCFDIYFENPRVARSVYEWLKMSQVKRDLPKEPEKTIEVPIV
jgi:hypothetical protein